MYSRSRVVLCTCVGTEDADSGSRLPLHVTRSSAMLIAPRKSEKAQWTFTHPAMFPRLDVSGIALVVAGVMSQVEPMLIATLTRRVDKRKGKGYFQSQRQSRSQNEIGGCC